MASTLRQSIDTPQLRQVFKSSSHAVLSAYDKESIQLEGAKKVLRYMQNLWKNNQLCDVIFECDGGLLYAHKVALGAYSEKLSRNFTGFGSNEVLTINMREFPKDSVNVILVFVYTTELNISLFNVADVLSCATELDVPYVKNGCIVFLSDNITVPYVFPFMDIADKHQLSELQAQLDRFLAEHFGEIIETEGFLGIPGDKLIRLLTGHTVSKTVRELSVLLAVVRWVESRHAEREPLLPALMRLINFHLIPAKDLINHVEKISVLTSNMETFQMLYAAMSYHALRMGGDEVFVMNNNRLFNDNQSPDWPKTFTGSPYLGAMARAHMEQQQAMQPQTSVITPHTTHTLDHTPAPPSDDHIPLQGSIPNRFGPTIGSSAPITLTEPGYTMTPARPRQMHYQPEASRAHPETIHELTGANPSDITMPTRPRHTHYQPEPIRLSETHRTNTLHVHNHMGTNHELTGADPSDYTRTALPRHMHYHSEPIRLSETHRTNPLSVRNHMENVQEHTTANPPDYTMTARPRHSHNEPKPVRLSETYRTNPLHVRNQRETTYELTGADPSDYTMTARPRHMHYEPEPVRLSQPLPPHPEPVRAHMEATHELTGATPEYNNSTYKSVAQFVPTGTSTGSLVVVAVGGIEMETESVNTPGRCVYQYDPQGSGMWKSLTSMPINTHHHGVAMVSDRLYVVGGASYIPNSDGDLGVAMATVNMYDMRSRRWTEVSRMNCARSYLSVAADDSFIYAVAGEDENRVRLGTVEKYDVRLNRWSHLTSIPSGPKVGSSSAVLGGKLYVIGGYNSRRGSTPVMADVECYDLYTNQWYIKRNLPEPRCHAGVVVAMGRMYLIGGRTKNAMSGVNSMSSILCYDEAADRWEHVANLHTPRHDAGCVAIGARIYIIGGIRSPSPSCLAAVECWDCSTGQWLHQVPNLPYTAAGLGACALKL